MADPHTKTSNQKRLSTRFLSRIIVSAASFSLIVTGCAVGPDFRRPDAPAATTYTATKLPEMTAAAPVKGGQAQRFNLTQDIPDQWWTIFQSPELDQLIRQALAGNPTLAAAGAALREAQEYYIAGRGSFFPSVDASASAIRQKSSGSASQQPTGTSPFTLYNASVSVSYALDVFGGMRRELESLQSQVEYQKFQLEGVYLTLTSTLVTTAVQEASLRSQIRSTRDILHAQEQQLAVVERQFQLGAVSLSDVLAQRTQLAQTRAALPPLEKALDQTRHQMAVLTGRVPGETTLPEFELDALKLPQDLPVTLPSELVRQRPDIRSSEALLHAASAEVGVATANLYPQITLSGSYGSKAIGTGTLFTSNSAFWSLGASLLQPVFRGGQLTAMRRAAIAAYDQSEARYRETTLLAFRDVADVLRALDADALSLKTQAEAESAARDALELARKQFALGAVSYLTLLNAQRTYQQVLIGLVQAQALRFADTAALFQALGGGWWNRSHHEDGAQSTPGK
jgi:NodT family efflux transporter outer membrane factor (OMF) lipoprotein